jgi:methionyl aminopeptidase
MHDKEGIVHMRAACELAARVLDYAGTLVKVSMPFSISTMFYLSCS